MKLIVLLRDPVIRAYSAHSHEKARGFEDLGFEAALAAEPERLAGERERLMAEPGYDSFHWQHHAYVTRGQYIEQVRALENLVGRERMCVVDSGDFFADPEPAFDEVRRFLGLEPCADIAFEQHNARQRSPLSTGAPDPPRAALRAVRRRAGRVVGPRAVVATARARGPSVTGTEVAERQRTDTGSDGPVDVVFVGGMPRSGSTLLDLLIGQLPGHCDVGELFYMWQGGAKRDQRCACGEHFSRCPFWTAVGTARLRRLGPGRHR